MANFLPPEPGIWRRKVVRMLRITTPLLFLCLVLLLLNWPFALSPAGRLPVAETAVASPVSLAPAMTPTAVLPTPTPLPTATPTPVPTATLPPEAQIRLLGPPEDALFRPDDSVGFYWQWPFPLEEGRFFRVIFRSVAGEVVLGEVVGANLGELFFLSASVSQLGETAVNGQWQVQLIAASGQVLLSSEPRVLRVLRP